MVQLFDRVVVAVDVERFSRAKVRRQLLIQEQLDRMLTEAASAARLDRSEWDRRGDGDGEVAVLPGDVDLLLIVRRFVTELDRLLADHNEDHNPETRIRLRVAMTHGSVVPGGKLGHGGKALIDLARLLDAAPLRKALKDVPGANLAQIISDSLFQRAVLPELDGLRPRQFRKVLVELPEKGFRENAYLYLPGGWPEPPRARPRPVGWDLPATGLPAGSFPRPLAPAPPPAAPPPGAERQPAAYEPAVTGLLADLRAALGSQDYPRADQLTTRILLAAAGRDEEGSLRTSDAERLPAALLNDLDAAWAASAGAWGFAAQREALAGSGRIKFHPLAQLLGWRQPDDAPPPRYAAFVATATRDVPFFPTLRSPDQENGQDETWREQWRTTAVSVHVRLQSWE